MTISDGRPRRCGAHAPGGGIDGADAGPNRRFSMINASGQVKGAAPRGALATLNAFLPRSLFLARLLGLVACSSDPEPSDAGQGTDAARDSGQRDPAPRTSARRTPRPSIPASKPMPEPMPEPMPAMRMRRPSIPEIRAPAPDRPGALPAGVCPALDGGLSAAIPTGGALFVARPIHAAGRPLDLRASVLLAALRICVEIETHRGTEFRDPPHRGVR